MSSDSDNILDFSDLVRDLRRKNACGATDKVGAAHTHRCSRLCGHENAGVKLHKCDCGTEWGATP